MSQIATNQCKYGKPQNRQTNQNVECKREMAATEEKTIKHAPKTGITACTAEREEAVNNPETAEREREGALNELEEVECKREATINKMEAAECEEAINKSEAAKCKHEAVVTASGPVIECRRPAVEQEGPHANYLGVAGECQRGAGSASFPVVECRRPALEEEGPHANYLGVAVQCQREADYACCPVVECRRPALEEEGPHANYLGRRAVSARG